MESYKGKKICKHQSPPNSMIRSVSKLGNASTAYLSSKPGPTRGNDHMLLFDFLRVGTKGKSVH